MRALSSQARPARLALAAAIGLLAGCGESAAPDDVVDPVRAPGIARIVPAGEALSGAHIPTIDPATMVDAEIQKALGAGPRCDFRYTGGGKPVLAMNMQPDGTASGGVMKLNGNLVPLSPAPADATGPEGRLLLTADPVRVVVAPAADDEAEDREGMRRREATMMFEIGQNLRVGYRGYMDCGAAPPVRSSRQ
ncbi:DUF6692 family protein [Microvirga lenta]|uniref:DUF6692 family protein n=1 Tax=Microvirga lenta TaxID=2881337 RepID=UPI001CFDB327|nr:DUF6692 family protein [Microvirga lenta]MCB5173695.1 hypothetical protein [Microvirga lenta]